MKKTKRITCMFLAMILLLALAIPVSADPPTGKITISNAEIGKTYTIYRIFDAIYDNGGTADDTSDDGIAYTTNNADLGAYIKTNASTSPVKVVGDPTGGVYTIAVVSGKTASDIRTWLTGDTVKALWQKDTYKSTADCTTGNTVEFDVPYGYYILYPGSGAVLSLDTNTPSVTIIDKNPAGPGNPVKADDKGAVAVGDTVTYTTTFRATNFLTTGTGDAVKTNIIEEYRLTDKYSAGLTFGSITSVELYADNDGSITTTKLQTLANTAYAVSGTTEGVRVFSIPWVTGTGTSMKSLYQSPCWVKITYTMAVDKDILSDADLSANNKISMAYLLEVDKTTVTADDLTDTDPDGIPVKHTVTPPTTPVPGKDGDEDTTPVYKKTTDPDPVYVYTTGLSVEKCDSVNQTTALTGAKFILWKNVEGDAKLYYTIDSTTKKITWVSDRANAAQIEADNNQATMEFEGLLPGTYYLYETVAPNGYSITGEPVELTISAAESGETVTFSMKQGDADLNAAGTGVKYFTLTVLNGKGKELPGTGGRGTVMMVSIGACTFLAAAVLLVSGKRARYRDWSD